MDIKEVMVRKYGPMPVWAWTALAASFIAGLYIFNAKMKGKSTATGGSPTSVNSGGPPGEFSSSQSRTTTDPNGNTTTTNFQASGPNSFMPGQLVTGAGPMPYSGGDVYVNYPANGAPPPPTQQTTNNIRQPLDLSNLEKGDMSSKGSPWLMTVAIPGETWLDVTARVYGFGKDFKSLTDQKDIARVKEVEPYIRNGPGNNAPGSTGDGPAPNSVVFFH
jgi:hypothetical protein